MAVVDEPDRITEHTTDAAHVAEGLALFVRKLRGRPALDAILTTWLAQVQEIEDALWDLYALTIDTSSDDALDQLGEVFVQPRPAGLSNVLYRRVLHGCVAALRSSGVGDDYNRVMAALVGSSAFTLTETFPAAVLLEPAATTGIPIGAMWSVLMRAKAAGVRLNVIDVPAGDALLLSDSMMRINSADPDHGFSDTTQVAGGVLVGVM